MNRILLLLIIVSLCSCQNDEKDDGNLITADKIGPLTKTAKVFQLDSIFSADSVARKKTDYLYKQSSQIVVYNNNGNEKLILNPHIEFDSTSEIGNIQVKDSVYHTKKGLNINSTFKDITTNYKISRIENTLNAIVIFIDEINIYVTIDKAFIDGEAKYNTDIAIEPTQIPDNAKIKHFWIGWK
ncbi:hypothetical protein [Mesonia sp. K7]|uniref:hypothetical protein n=1 Tax=Mesonia sp. K7 TaxID=2218606 RepID=UPI000DAA024A|nr:hypothetical protein [Mesonia sp. K7]PZD77590.1 hypothetical protein DNG35_08390 [Mesonia sp. K7]